MICGVSGSSLGGRVVGVKKALLCYTCDREHATQTHLLEWQISLATIADGQISVALPENTYQCFLSVYDELPEEMYCCTSGNLSEWLS